MGRPPSRYLDTASTEILELWDDEKNFPLVPSDVAYTSHKQAYWKCDKGHSWKANISSITRIGSRCPYCSGRKPIPGENDLATTDPDQLQFWDYDNNTVLPSEVSRASGKKIAWICGKGHRWTATPANKVAKGKGCPGCSGNQQVRSNNNLAAKAPQLAKEWDYDNNGTTPEEISYGSNIAVSWKCISCHHTWIATVKSRWNGSGCPNCRKIKPKSKDPISTTHPLLAQQWHSGNTKSPDDVTFGSTQKIQWRCEKGHEWTATPNSRAKKNGIVGCPYCTGVRAIPGETDFLTLYPRSADEWHPTKNISGPEEFKPGSDKRVWWKCSEGHEWESEVRSRANDTSMCPTCAGKEIVPGVNDIATLMPALMKEWDDDKDPATIGIYSPVPIHWRCSEGHEWDSAPNTRRHDNQCPVCSGISLVQGVNDLTTRAPWLVSEWNKKNDLKPDEVFGHSNKKVWWKCDEGHEWKAIVNHRVYGADCPICSPKGASKIELEVYARLLKLCDSDLFLRNQSVEAQWGQKRVSRCDMAYVGDRKTIIEYDGEYWHSLKIYKDIEKTRALLDADWTVLRIREGNLCSLSEHFPTDNYIEISTNRALGVTPDYESDISSLVSEITAVCPWITQ